MVKIGKMKNGKGEEDKMRLKPEREYIDRTTGDKAFVWSLPLKKVGSQRKQFVFFQYLSGDLRNRYFTWTSSQFKVVFKEIGDEG